MHLPEQPLLLRGAWPVENGDQIEVAAARLVIASGERSVRPYRDQREDRPDGSDEAVEKLDGGFISHTDSLRHTTKSSEGELARLRPRRPSASVTRKVHFHNLLANCWETREGGTAPTIALLRRLAAALNADVRLTSGHDLGSMWFEAHAA
jgi:hypothetical protein